MPNGKSKTLSLCEKMKVIEEHEQYKLSPRLLAQRYGVGKTQVYETLKNKEKIKLELSKGTSGQRKRFQKISSYEDVNKEVWEWFSNQVAQGLEISGPMIQAEAKKIASTLGKHEFKASNGWLECFRARHNIVCNQVCVGEKDVIVQLEEDRRTTILNVIENYQDEDVFVAHETTLYYKILSANHASGKPTEKLNVLLCANMKGHVIKPLVVGETSRPESFGNLDIASLPVLWRGGTQAIMSKDFLEEWLIYFNGLMFVESRQVVLFLDNFTSYTLISLSNVRIVWCPDPLDRGFISYFKCFYRKSLLEMVVLLSEDSGSSAFQECKSVSLLNAVSWISKACNNIPPELVSKCFMKSGFVVRGDFASNDDAEEKLFNDIFELCRRISIDLQDVLKFDDSLCESDPVGWVKIKEEFDYEEGGPSFVNIKEDISEDEPTIKTFCDAVKAVGDLEKFAADKNCPQLLNLLQEAKDLISESFLKS